jgi:anti-anti-sigma factor
MTCSFVARRHDVGAGVVRIAVSGEVDVDTSETVAALIAEAAAEPGTVGLIIGLAQAGFLDATGIRVLLVGREVAVRNGCSYRVTNPRGFIHSVLAVSGVFTILDVRTGGRHHGVRRRRSRCDDGG